MSEMRILERLTEAQLQRLEEAIDRGSIRRAYEVLEEAGSSSDFPYLLANVQSKVMQTSYRAVPDEWRRFTRRTTLPDFKEKQILRLSESDDLLEVKEGGEYQDSTLSEAKETYKLSKYGREYSVTWETIVNDDLDAIRRQPERFGRAAARKVNQLIYQGILEANPTMGDGLPLFHASHGNLGSQALSEASLSAAITAMRKQTDDRGNPIVASPAFLIVPPDLEFTAKKLVQSTLVPGSNNNDVNALRGIVEPIVVPWLTDPNDWYLVANPADIDTIEVGFLRDIGEEPQLFVKDSGWRFAAGAAVDPISTGVSDGPDGIRYRVRHVVAAKAADWRGLYKSQVA